MTSAQRVIVAPNQHSHYTQAAAARAYCPIFSGRGNIFLSPNFSPFLKKTTFSTATPDYLNYPPPVCAISAEWRPLGPVPAPDLDTGPFPDEDLAPSECRTHRA